MRKILISIFLFVLVALTALASSSLIKDIISINDWNLIGDNVETVISTKVISGEVINADILNAKFYSINQKINMTTSIGEIKHSLLDKNSFQGIYGNCWVLVSDPLANLPNMEGRFLRNSNSNEDYLGQTEEYSTALPNNPFVTSVDGNHRHKLEATVLGAGSGTYDNSGTHDSSRATHTNYAGEHTHIIENGGDEETRPENLTVNMFIRINNDCDLGGS